MNLVCPTCGKNLTPSSDGLACPACSKNYPIQGDIPRFTPVVDEGFDTRWALHPKPQATTQGIFEQKTGWTKQDLQGQVVLDAGCGCGRFSQVAASYGASVIGVDGSTHGIEAAKALVPMGTFVQANLLRLPVPSDSVDKAFSIGVLHHTSDAFRAFSEVARVVKPGGELAVWLYVNPGGDQDRHIVDPEVALAAEFLHAITKACPPDKLHLACEQYAPGLRDLYNKKWGPLQQVLRASISEDDAECISDTFDWHCPQYRTGHTIEEIRGWFERVGFDVEWVGGFPVSMRGRKRVQAKREPVTPEEEANPDPEIPPLPSSPELLTFYIGDICNAKCIMCWQALRRDTTDKATWWKEMPAATVAGVLSEHQQTLKAVEIISFGEPMANPDFEGMVEAILQADNTPGRAQPLWFNLTTNGSLLHKHMRMLKVPGYLTFSMDGASKEVYEYIRKGLDWDRVYGNLRAAMQDPQRHPERHLGIAMTVFEDNVHEVLRMAEHCAELGLYYFNVMRGANLVGSAAKGREILATDPRLVEAIDTAKSRYKFIINDFATGRTPFFVTQDAPKQYCPLPWKQIDIGPDGEAHPCCRSHYTKLGHASTNPWVGKPYQRLRAQILANDVDPIEFKDCATCPHLNAGVRTRPTLIAVGGLRGVGKSSLVAATMPHLVLAPNHSEGEPAPRPGPVPFSSFAVEGDSIWPAQQDSDGKPRRYTAQQRREVRELLGIPLDAKVGWVSGDDLVFSLPEEEQQRRWLDDTLRVLTGQVDVVLVDAWLIGRVPDRAYELICPVEVLAQRAQTKGWGLRAPFNAEEAARYFEEGMTRARTGRVTGLLFVSGRWQPVSEG